jgi:phenylalanyl-tRNA synthetase beta chain
MRVSYAWLRELLPELAASPEEVADRLRGAGLAVDAMQSFGVGQQPVVLAQVRRVEPHPARAALQLVTVDRGGGHEQRVVCGASNVPPAGQLVALAPLGAVLPKLGSALTPREIGGVLSEGMLCSESELGLAETSNGILVLPEGAAAPGTLLSAALPAAADTIFELDITPNRPDALGHVGIARDLAVLFGGRFNVVDPGAPQRVARDTIEQLVRVENRDPERCPRYGAAAALDVQVRESPAWMRWRLHSLGIRPISNVVDITNWLLLEYGHPMHAFDLDRVSGGRIIIRRASDGEAFTTLDGVARSLSGDDLVIADGERPSALAGIMGGQDSEISDSTRRVLLECAYFAPRGIRRSARRHGMHTESSHRFERGVDIAAVPRVLARAQALLSELADATAVAGLIDASCAPRASTPYSAHPCRSPTR